MAADMRYRDYHRIHESHRVYEPLILSLDSDPKLRRKIARVWNGVTEEIGVALAQQCHTRLDRLGMEFETGLYDLKCCVLDVEKRLDPINRDIKKIVDLVDNDHLDDSERLQLEARRNWLEKRALMLRSKEIWNGTRRKRNCADFTRDQAKSGHFCFGAVDMVYVLPVPSAMWSGAFRMCYALPSIVSGLFGFPMHRIKSARSVNKGEVTDQRRPLPEDKEHGRFIAYTFLHKPNVQFVIGGKNKAAFVLRVCNFFLPHHNQAGDRVPPRIERYLSPRIYTEARIELFLTLSVDFPVMIKSEFLSIDHLSEFLTVVDNRFPAFAATLAPDEKKSNSMHVQTSSMIGWHDPLLKNNKPSQKETASPVTFQLLIKCESHPYRVANHVVRLLKQELGNVGKPVLIRNSVACSKDLVGKKGPGFIMWHERPYYWDFSIQFRTRRVSRLLELMADEIRELEGVAHAATMPFLTAGMDLRNSVTGEITVHKMLNGKLFGPVAKANPYTPAIKKEHDTVMDHLGKWSSDIARYSECLEGLGADDGLTNRYVGTHRELRTLYAYTIQLEESWNAQVRLRTHDDTEARSFLKPRQTFEVLRRHVQNALDEFRNIDKELKPFANAIRAAAAARAAKGESVDAESIITSRYRETLWNKLELIRQRSDEIKKVLLAIAAEFHNRTESHQIINFTDHPMKVGEQAGVLDLTIEAVGRLFRRYCGEPHPRKIHLWKADPKKKVFRNADPTRWQGLFISSTGNDYVVFPQERLLYLPMDLRFSTRGKVLVVAHEAAHQALHIIQQNKRNRALSGRNNRTVFISFNKWWQGFIAGVSEQMHARGFDRNRVISASLGELGNDEIQEVEFLADFLGLLAAGPGYIREMIHYIGVPFETEKSINRGDRPQKPGNHHDRPVWLRIANMYMVALQLGWLTEINDDFGIKDLVNNYFQQHEKPKHLSQMLFGSTVMHHHHNMHNVEPQDKQGPRPIGGSQNWSLLDALMSDNRNTWKKLAKWFAEEYRDYPANVELFMFSYLKSDSGRQSIRDLVQWCQNYGSKFLFYPMVYEEDGLLETQRDVESAWLRYPAVVSFINQYCSMLYDRLVYNDEVILDAPLRYIAAASAMDSKPGRYSTGRLLHSLYYSDWMTAYKKLMADLKKTIGDKEIA